MNYKNPTFLVVDLFCGFGGTTLGFDKAKNSLVIACVNHDPKAIKSHWLNHPRVTHFEEDIRTLDLSHLKVLVGFEKAMYPNAKLVLWASLECTNFSKAKGGQSRDADSRTLAEHLPRYITAIDPDYIMIENVVEFMAWGPLDENGKPISKCNGESWNNWRNNINSMGYYDDWKELNSANFGAFTSRNRLFGCFAKHGLPINWPKPTHSKNPEKSLIKGLKKWNAVRDVLELTDEGSSIFGRKKPLCDNTLKVILSGAEKAIKNGETEFLYKYYGNGDNLNQLDQPAGTVTTKDRFAKVKLIRILRNYKTGFTQSIDVPMGTIPTVPKAYLVSYIMNPGYRGHTHGIDKPAPVIIARQDKAPLYLIQVFMSANDIADIKMRMLKVPELLKIQGFPVDYQMVGNQTDHKKFIGNSVEPNTVSAWIKAMGDAVNSITKAVLH